MSPLSTLPPPQPSVSTAVGCLEIMNFTKMQVLPDPNSDALTSCDDNSAMRVLMEAIYCQLERHYFDETHSRVDIATLFFTTIHHNYQKLSRASITSQAPTITNQRKQASGPPGALIQTLQKQRQHAQKMLPNLTQKNWCYQKYQRKTRCQAPAVAASSLQAYSEEFQNCLFFF